MKVSHWRIVYGARRCKDARARGVRSMVGRVRGLAVGRSRNMFVVHGGGMEDGGRVLIRRREEERCAGG